MRFGKCFKKRWNSNFANIIRELELELAQTKLALVETECKNQDLSHQFSAALSSPPATASPATSVASSSKTWFVCTCHP